MRQRAVIGGQRGERLKSDPKREFPDRPRPTLSGSFCLHTAALAIKLAQRTWGAQERCKWSSDGDPSTVTSYPQQLNIDVGDAPGHIVGVYEIYSVAGSNSKPNCEGLKDKETWTYGYRDYRDRNGRTWGYIVTTLENGDKIYQEYSGTTETTVAADGSTKTTTDNVATWTGGTGRYQTVRGIERDHVARRLGEGRVETHRHSHLRGRRILVREIAGESVVAVARSGKPQTRIAQKRTS